MKSGNSLVLFFQPIIIDSQLSRLGKLNEGLVGKDR